MFYSVFVFLLGIYIGQEYKGIPSVKSSFQVLMEHLNKLSEEETQVAGNTDDDNYNIQPRFTPIKKPYYSLPEWFSGWWSGSSSRSCESSVENQKDE